MNRVCFGRVRLPCPTWAFMLAAFLTLPLFVLVMLSGRVWVE